MALPINFGRGAGDLHLHLLLHLFDTESDEVGDNNLFKNEVLFYSKTVIGWLLVGALCCLRKIDVWSFVGSH